MKEWADRYAGTFDDGWESNYADTEWLARIGVCNVNRAQLDEALELAPISVVQVALSILDDTAARGGIVERCADAGIALVAHTPLGGPRRVGRLAREEPSPRSRASVSSPRARTRLGPRSRAERRRDTRGSTTGNGSLSARAASIRLDENERARLGRDRRPRRSAAPARVTSSS
jgi:hypothetical protein